MLLKAFRTKERKVTAFILGLILIVIGVFLFTNYSGNRKFIEQAVMAENYLEAGNYREAVDAYQKAMSMKKATQQNLAIGLADAYVGLNEYDMALEALRSCYQKASGVKVKEKIEEVTSKKTEYEYLQAATRAEVYFSNKEYDKAIAEYEKAKLIKSKKATSYQRIAEAYMEIDEYEKAREEILEGQELTQDESLDKILVIINTHLIREKYDKLISQAEEYINQENYKDGITQYEAAIALLPKKDLAYIGLANVYLARKEFNRAVLLLQSVIEQVDSDELSDLLKKATKLKTGTAR